MPRLVLLELLQMHHVQLVPMAILMLQQQTEVVIHLCTIGILLEHQQKI